MYFQIIQTEGLVTFLFELEHQYHRVFTDGRDHPEPLEHHVLWQFYRTLRGQQAPRRNYRAR